MQSRFLCHREGDASNPSETVLSRGPWSGSMRGEVTLPSTSLQQGLVNARTCMGRKELENSKDSIDCWPCAPRFLCSDIWSRVIIL